MGIYLGGVEYNEIHVGGVGQKEAHVRGAEVFALGPVLAHSFAFTVRGSGASVGYNVPGGFATLQAGSSDEYVTPRGTAVRIQQFRTFRGTKLVFVISGTEITLDDFPTHIEVHRLTTTLRFTRPANTNPRGISSGQRLDYETDNTTQQINTVFDNGRPVTARLYYGE